ncbi:MAG: hypothetical protein BGO69_03315 [Bacteroidetes bacterium 46-16]|nr:MAG: hypothetical protein BGO69_03315 [Bacteroidetes bacterium 46-16]
MRVKLLRYVYIISIIALLLGAADPMEGSIVIAAGAVLLALSAHFQKDRYSKIFIASALMIFFGVFNLWFVSSLGGFDPKREWWWLVFIIPYPVGWIVSVVTLVVKAVKKTKTVSA